MKEFKHGELEEATHNYSKAHLIGKGSHGCIYRATLTNGQVVAIKTPSSGLCTSKIENEARVLSSISPNRCLVNLLGTSHDSNGHTVLVMEHMPGGMLHDSLHFTTPPSWPRRAKTAVQIARAVRFLHESDPLIIHRDIKSENILFDSKSNARLADFGLAVCVTSHGSPSQVPAGTIGYLDPCYPTTCKLSTRTDVFSFGVVLLEIISGTKAIDVSRAPASIVEWSLGLIGEDRMMEVCDRTVRMARHMEGVIRGMLALAMRCVSSDEESRPSMAEVVSRMERFRFPLWTDVVQCLAHIRSRKKVASKTFNDTTSQGHVGTTRNLGR